MRQAAFQLETGMTGAIPWAIQMKGVSLEEPGRLVLALTEAILCCGGWVLTRSASDTGAVNLLFEFERRVCMEMYGGLVGAGIDLTQNGHVRFTELCQCILNDSSDRGAEVATIDLEVQTFPPGAGGNTVFEEMD
jgi:hypothetical protein